MLPNYRIITFMFILLFFNSGLQLDATIPNEYSQSQVDYEEFTVDVSGAEVDIVKTPEAFDGYNLFVLLRTHKVTREGEFFMLIVDMNGGVILEESLQENDAISDCPAEFIGPTSILVRSNNTMSIYNVTDGSMDLLPFAGHHEFEYNPIDDTFFTFHSYTKNIDGVDYLYDTLLEFDRAGNIVWSFDVSSLMSIDQECLYHDYLFEFHDISHANTIYYDVEDDSIYLMLRNANTFWKIDHSSGEAIWGLGEHGNFSLYNRWGESTDNLFYHAHAVEKVDDNSFILYDNDYHNLTDDSIRVSRILEITIDEDTMIANTSWVWAADSEYSSYLWGDADRLPNGNRLGAFGFLMRPDTDYGGRLVEVNEDHDIVWEMSFVNDETYWYGMYRVERFQFQPVLQVVDSRNVYSQGDTTIDWQVWYNYRPKRNIPGFFELYLDDLLVQDGDFTFDRYWRPTSLSHTFQEISLGIHNVTLVVRDNYGNSAKLVTEINMTNENGTVILLIAVSVSGIVALVILLKYRNRS